MTGLYIFGALIVLGVGALFYYKIKWARSGQMESRSRAANIEKERVERLANRKA